MADLGKEEQKGGVRDGIGQLRSRRPSLTQVAERARRELVQVTGLPPEGVTSLERHDDGTWTVTCELLEFSRIPNTDDVLGTYEATVDPSGELLGYRRVRRYARTRSLQGQGSV
jgi:hypothetical protein